MRLGMSSGSLSETLSGKRVLSHATKQRIAPKIFLSPQETIEFFGNDFPNSASLASDDRVTLNQDQFHLISDWWYFGLLNLIKMRGFKSHFGWMAKRLGLSVQIVRDAWEPSQHEHSISDRESLAVRSIDFYGIIGRRADFIQGYQQGASGKRATAVLVEQTTAVRLDQGRVFRPAWPPLYSPENGSWLFYSLTIE